MTRSWSKDSLLTIASQAIDAKSRGNSFEVFRLCEMLIEHPHQSEAKEELIKALSTEGNEDPARYIDLLKKLDEEIYRSK